MSHYNKLTKASLGHILEDKNIIEPIVQLIAYKNIVQPDGSDRYWLILSDGIYLYQCCLIVGYELKQKIANNEIDRYCLIKLKKYVLNKVENKKVIVLVDVDKVVSGSEINDKLANPISYGLPNAPPTSNFKPNYHLVEKEMENEFDDSEDHLFWCSLSDLDLHNYSNDSNNNDLQSTSKRMRTDQQPSTSCCQSNTPPRRLNANLVSPIVAITPFSFHWMIKGRVISKSHIRKWSNVRGEGILFTFEIQDSSGQIRVAAFGKQCSKFFNRIQFDRCYLIAKGRVKEANKMYTSNNYEISCTEETIIEPLREGLSQDCPTIRYDFVDFLGIQAYNVNSIVDVVGIVVEIEELTTYNRKRTNVEGSKRNIQLVDQTRNQIMLTLWEFYAKEFNCQLGDIVVVKNVCVNDFHGCSLSTSSNSVIRVNPQMSVVYDLRAWFNENHNVSLNVIRLTNKPSSTPAEWSTLSAITLETVKQNNKTFLVKACITYLGRPNMYKACKICMKKLTDIEGLLRCDRCSVDAEDYDWKLMLTFCLIDHTSTLWVTAFNDVCEKLYANEDFNNLGMIFENQYENFEDRLTCVKFKSFLFKLKCKSEVYNNEEKLRIVVNDVQTVNGEYQRRLLDEIKNSQI